jgi:hypothetical protein
MALPDSIYIIHAITKASDEAETEMWNMRQKHIFEMAWLCDKQADRRAKYQDLRLPIESIQVPPNLFAKVEIKRIDSNRVELYFDGKKQNYIADVKIELLPAKPAKITCTQIKTNNKGQIYSEIVEGKERIARRTFEVLASSLIVDM